MNSEELLKQGIATYKAGRKAEARDLFLQALEQDPRNEKAWLWLSGVVDSDGERRSCLEKVLEINPFNGAARQGLEHLEATTSPPAPSVQPLPRLSVATSPIAPEPDPVEPEGVQQKLLAVEHPLLGKQEDEGGGLDWMIVFAIGLVLVCVIAFGAIALLQPWETSGGTPTETPGQITAVIYENIAAHNAEDIDRYMATIHRDSKMYDDTRDTLPEAYRSYDLYATLEDVELVRVTKKEARVSFVLTTKKLRGPAFSDNRVEGEFILRKEDGRWKLYDQKIKDVEYLE